jgi:hypothetical protein
MPSYYKIIDGERYDRQLLETAQQLTEGRGDGRISQKDAEIIWNQVQDGGNITATEKRTIIYLLQKLNWSDKAAEWINSLMTLSIDPEEETSIEHIIRIEYDLEQLRYDFQPEYINKQESIATNKLDFPNALRAALHTILNSKSERESPRFLIGNIFGWFPEQDPKANELITEKLYESLQSGQLTLLPNLDWDDEDIEFDFNPPEERESAELNWIFTLYLPTLSDHLYWIVVPRDGKTEAYIYGFN